MGKVDIITFEQSLLLEEFKKDSFLSSNFYFTGGTALSLFYLKHRKSIDLDFFSRDKFDPLEISERVEEWAKKLGAQVKYTPRQVVHPFILTFENNTTVKVDFGIYPHQQLNNTNSFEGIAVDSLLDIATNKLLTIEQRTEVKDFVDLYFLLKQFSVWDLIEGVRVKFRLKLDPFIVASDYFKVETFDFLPDMIKPLDLASLKKYFLDEARRLGRDATG